MAVTAVAVALSLGGEAALAGEITDGHLHLVRHEVPVLIERGLVAPGPYWLRHRHWGVLLQEREVDEVYVTKGPFRISEPEFIAIVDEGGQSPSLVREIRDRQSAAAQHGLAALGSWAGLFVAANLADAGVGQTNVMLGRSALSFNTAAIGAVILGVLGLVNTLWWFDDQRPLGAPFFSAFSVAQAQEAIDAYNRHYDLTHRTVL